MGGFSMYKTFNRLFIPLIDNRLFINHKCSTIFANL